MADPFETHAPGLTSPIAAAAPITPDDGADLPTVTRALFVGGAGDVVATLVSGDVVTLTGMAAGIWHPVRVARIHATGTDATGLVGGW